jgi:hypothetical protein
MLVLKGGGIICSSSDDQIKTRTKFPSHLQCPLIALILDFPLAGVAQPPAQAELRPTTALMTTN